METAYDIFRQQYCENAVEGANGSICFETKVSFTSHAD